MIYHGIPRRNRVHVVGAVNLPDEVFVEVYGETHNDVRTAMLARLAELQAAITAEIAEIEATPAPETIYEDE